MTPVEARSAESNALSTFKVIFICLRFVWLEFHGNPLDNGRERKISKFIMLWSSWYFGEFEQSFIEIRWVTVENEGFRFYHLECSFLYFLLSNEISYLSFFLSGPVFENQHNDILDTQHSVLYARGDKIQHICLSGVCLLFL